MPERRPDLIKKTIRKWPINVGAGPDHQWRTGSGALRRFDRVH